MSVPASVRGIAKRTDRGIVALSPRAIAAACAAVRPLSTTVLPTPSERKRSMIVGLGNHGLPLNQRHSIGMVVVNRLASDLGVKWQSQRTFDFAEDDALGLVLVKPRTYMNLSGGAVFAAVSQFRFADMKRVLVVHDDLERPLSKTSFKDGGSANGHNGLRSISATMRTQDFPRLRVGIGRPADGDVTEYVLGQFDSRERTVVADVVQACCAEILKWHEKANAAPKAPAVKRAAKPPLPKSVPTEPHSKPAQ